MTDFPALTPAYLDPPTLSALAPPELDHPPRFLLLYGSLRERSYSRLMIEEAARLLTRMGPKRASMIPGACRSPMTPIRPTRRCRNCARPRCGPRAMSGAARNATAP